MFRAKTYNESMKTERYGWLHKYIHPERPNIQPTLEAVQEEKCTKGRGESWLWQLLLMVPGAR